VLVAFLLGLSGQLGLQRFREGEQRKQTKESLSKELAYLNGQVAGVPTAVVINAPLDQIPADTKIELPTDAKESALASGRYALLSVNLQTKVSQVYIAVERAGEYRGKTLETLSGTMNQVSNAAFYASFREQLDFLAKNIPLL